jgi:soluble lytic murein transglycosylase
MRYFFLFIGYLLIASTLEAKTFSFSKVHSMPQSVEKDYYIWRYLSQRSTSASQARAIIKDVNHLNGKLKKAYKKKTSSYPRVHPKPVKLDYSKVKRKVPTKREKYEWRVKSKKLKSIFRQKSPAIQWKSEEPFVKCFVFNKCGRSKRKRLNRPMSKREYQKLTTHKSFNQSVPYIMSENLTHLKKALYYTPAKNNALTSQTHLKIAMYALRDGRIDVAKIYFNQARLKDGSQEAKDKARFWLYLLTKNEGYLQPVLKGNNINFYALVSRDILHAPYPKTITPKFAKSKISKFDSKNPIHWAYLKRKIYQPAINLNKLANKFKSKDTVGIYSYIKTNASLHKNNYFPMPYRRVMKQLPKERQALIYAIARQESRFVPASVSRSFALGLMQFMPFLIDHVAKERGEKIDYDDIFNPNKAIIYANHHLNYLIKHLYSPLFIAYAYNGGIGFTRRLITSGKYFKRGRYEPYMSMEMMKNSEAREYGKKVLTNYVIYLNKLGISARILPFLRVLNNPLRTDRFRK